MSSTGCSTPTRHPLAGHARPDRRARRGVAAERARVASEGWGALSPPRAPTARGAAAPTPRCGPRRRYPLAAPPVRPRPDRARCRERSAGPRQRMGVRRPALLRRRGRAVHQRPGRGDRRLFRPGRPGHRRSAADRADGRRRLELRAGASGGRRAVRSTRRSTSSRVCSSTSGRPAATPTSPLRASAARSTSSSGACCAGCRTARSATQVAALRVSHRLALRRPARPRPPARCRRRAGRAGRRGHRARRVEARRRRPLAARPRPPRRAARRPRRARRRAEPLDHAACAAGPSLGRAIGGGIARAPHRHDRRDHDRSGQRGRLGGLQAVFGTRGEAASASASATSSRRGSPSARFRPRNAPCGFASRPTPATRRPRHDRPHRVPRRRARRLVRGRAAHQLPRPPRVYRSLGGHGRGQARRRVWAVTCVFVREGFRRRGIGYALARAAADFARERGARAWRATR